MNDLLLTGEDQGADYWPIRFERMGESEEKESEEEEERGRKEPQSFMFHSDTHPISPLPPSHPPLASGQTELQTDTKGKDYAEDVARSSQGCNDERQSQVGLNGTQSESSGEFSLENEGWSSSSSPVQGASSSRRGSDGSPAPPASASTPLTQASAPPKPPRDGSALESYASGRGVWRSSSGRATGPRGVLSQTQAFRTIAITIEGSRATGASPPPTVQVQDKSSGAAGCLDCFSAPLRREGQGGQVGQGQGGQGHSVSRGQGRVLRAFSTLPRASNVISTSEGSSRRASFHSMMSKSATPSPRKNGTDVKDITANPNQISNPTSNPSSALMEPAGGDSSTAAAAAEMEASLEPPALFGSPFTLDSVFTNTIFSESSLVSSGGKSQTFLCLNPALVHNISSGPPLSADIRSFEEEREELSELGDLHREQDEAQEGESGQGPQDCSTSEDYMTVTERSASLAPDNKHSLMA
ncbi:hypothetical protein AALO_G00101500 [Alosa alosa]|uniref:Uncharacterized protein n=1 Tax=Alosa alosa TaxID=278164 RepID=A0AAV6GUQ4_9TELE|nr:hypothetical protein AALO_G00101500 [Alosa alosa]